MQATDRSRYGILLFLFFVSGAAALIYEVLWLKELGRLFGVTAYAAATTLAVFFLGLAAGGLAWGLRAERLRNPLRAYALLELGIAVSALLYFLLLDLYRWVYTPIFATIGYQPLLSLLVKFALAVGILFLPAFFMGGTLPVMAQFMVRSADQLGRKASLLYALNTAGAATGAFLAGFVLPRQIGYRNSYFVAITLNLLVAVVAFAWSRTGLGPPAPARRPPAAAALPLQELEPRLLWLAAFVSGFVTLGLEVLWTRMFAQVLQNSVYTFAMILVVFLIALSLGSALANLLCRLRWPPPLVLFGVLNLSGLLVGLTPAVFYQATSGLEYVGGGRGWSEYVFSVFGLISLVLLLPTVVMGAVFPYLMKLSEARMVSAGRTIGRLAAINIVAAILGSLTAGFVLLTTMGLWAAIRLMAVLYFALGFLALPGPWRTRLQLRSVAAVGILVFALGVTYSDFAAVRLDSERQEEPLEVWEGSHGTVAVVSGQSGLGIKVNNSYQLGTSKSALNVRIQSWLPLSLHPQPASVFYLGMGTGLTASGALDLPVKRVVICELNADVIRASRKHFRPYLRGLFEDPRVEIYPEDGRTYLLGTRERFDAVIADIFLTYKAGVGSLYTLEHFQAVHDHLAPGGIFVQWLPLFDLSEEEFGIIARTMLEVFPQVTLWRRGLSPKFPVFALIGHQEHDPIDRSLLYRQLGLLKEKGALPGSIWLQNIPFAAYAGNIGALRPRFEAYPVSTDDRTPLEYLAPITERDSKGSKAKAVLAWSDLAAFCDTLLEALPPDRDPYLEGLTDRELRQVRAGLAYYRYETSRRLGMQQDAAAFLQQYQRLLDAPDAGGGSFPVLE